MAGEKENQNKATQDPNGAVAELQQELEARDSRIVVLEGEVSKLQTLLDEATANLKDSEAVIDDMQGTINKKTAQNASGSNLPTVKVGKKVYQIRVAKTVRFKGKDYTAKDIQDNVKLAESLVKISAGCLVEVE